MKQKKIMKLASRGKRLGAYCIDAAVPIVLYTIFMITVIVEMVRDYSYTQDFGYGYEFGDPLSGYGYGYQSQASDGTTAVMVIALILSIAYVIVQIVMYRKSMSIGKAALGLQVVSSNNGEPIGFWKMLFREWFVKKASGSVFLLGYIWVLIDEKNRGWHDKILDTYVVDLRESAAYNAAAASGEVAAATARRTVSAVNAVPAAVPKTDASERNYAAPSVPQNEAITVEPVIVSTTGDKTRENEQQ